jgi:hypothetical protein
MYKDITIMFGVLTYYFLAYTVLYSAAYGVINALK